MKKLFLLFMLSGLFFACGYAPADSIDKTEVEVLKASVNSTTDGTITAEDADLWLPSLITATPQEGRELAITMARKTIGAIQSDGEVKKRLRGEYAENAELLILSAEVVAREFQTVAAANNYWRDK